MPPLSESMYYCTDKTESMTLCFNSVIVGTKPREVLDFSCVSHNFENLTCTWTAPQNYVKTDYSLKYGLQGRNSRGFYQCPKIEPLTSVSGETAMKCFWDLSTAPLYRQTQQVYYFVLQAANQFGNMSIKHNFTHFANVIPEPSINLTIINKTTDSMLLSWSVPVGMRLFPPGMLHRVRYQCEFDDKNSWTTADTSALPPKNTSYLFKLSGLPYAHALYDIRLSSRSAKAVDEDERLWSRFTSITARTVSKLPGTPPTTVSGSFEVVNRLTQRDIIVYWQYVPDHMKNGENVTYRVSVAREGGRSYTRTGSSVIMPDETSNTYAKFNGLLSNSSYVFTVVTANEMGVSRNVSHVYVPAYNERVPEPTVLSKIAFTGRTYGLTWMAPERPKDPHDHSHIVNYTIFWCNNDRDRPYLCKGYLRWLQVPPHLTSYNVTVNDSEIYQFAVSANTDRHSSGMIWSSCTVIPMNGGIGKMKNIWIDSLGSRYIHVSWKLGCSDHIGGIEGFKIYYCPIVSPVEWSCKEEERVLPIEKHRDSANITDLQPYTTYVLSVSAITKHNSDTLQSERLFNTTMEDRPSSPPQHIHLSNITNSSLNLTWSPPTSLNGVLRYYEISYQAQAQVRLEADTDAYTDVDMGDYRSHTVKHEPNKESTLPDKRQTVLLTQLRSYTRYAVHIRACTIRCSAPSNSLFVRTNMSSKCDCKPVVVELFIY